MDSLVSENHRLRKELKANKIAYAKLNSEKDEAIKALKQANEKIAKLESLLKLKEQLLIEIREEKEKEVAELVKIKNDLEMRLQSALEDGMFDLETPRRTSDVTFPQVNSWSQGYGHSSLSCAKALEILKEWEGISEVTEQLKNLLEEEQDSVFWKPGTPLNVKWKPNIRVYVSADDYLNEALELLQNELFPRLESFCRNAGVSLSFITLMAEHLEDFSLSSDLVSDLSSQEIKVSDFFIGILGGQVNHLSKSEIEHAFLNNPSIRPSVFLFLQNHAPSVTPATKRLKQRVRNSSSYTNITECEKITDDVLNDLYYSITNTLKASFHVFEPANSNQESTFTHLTLLADMRVEYEQNDILNTILRETPNNPVCLDLTFENLKAYMMEKTTVAPFLITAPTGSGKSVLLAKWVEILQKDYQGEVAVLYHFVTHACSTSSESCLMYRRFCHKLMLLYDAESSSASLAVDPDAQEEIFSEWLNKTAAMVEQSKIIFFVIDNAEVLQDHSQLSWLHKPLPKNVRVVLTVNDSSHYPDSWKHLASCTLPTPTSSDLQVVLPNILYGNRKQSLSDDQTIGLVIVSQYSFLWCVLAARYVLSLTDKLTESEIDDILPNLEDITEVPEIAKILIEDMETTYPSLIIAIEQIVQLIYWSRSGLAVNELQQLLQFPDIIICFVVNELKKRSIIWEIAGILQFTHESVLELMQFKYHLDTLPEDLLIWPETLIRFFSDIKSQLLSRCADELPWLLKRGEFQQDLANVLLNIDILIQLYCSGQGGLLLKYWRWIGTIKDNIPEQYKVELGAVEDQAGGDENSLLYVAMVMLTVGKILRNLGLIEETQPLLLRALELYEGHCDVDNEKVADAMSELALLYILMKKYSAAECYYNQSLEIYEQLFDEHSDQAIHVLEALKKIYKETKKPELLDGIGTRLISLRDQRRKSKPTAQTIIMKHMAALETHLNSFENEQPPNEEYVRGLNGWAVIHAAFGQERLADDFFYTALNSSETGLGANHKLTLCVLKNWTTLHIKMNKIPDAITLQSRILEIKERLDEYDIDFAAITNNLANLHCLNGCFKQAILLYDKAVEIYATHYGDTHPSIQEALENKEIASQKSLELSF